MTSEEAHYLLGQAVGLLARILRTSSLRPAEEHDAQAVIDATMEAHLRARRAELAGVREETDGNAAAAVPDVPKPEVAPGDL